MANLSTRAAAQMLGIEPTDVTELSAAGFLPPPVREGNRKTYPEEAVCALATREDAPVDLPALVVRMGPPVSETDSGESRAFRGLAISNYPGATKAASERHRRAAVGRWWPVADPEAVIGLPIVATVSGFVGAVYCATALAAHMFGRASFDLEACDKATAARYEGRRLRLPPGPIAFRLPR